MVVEGTPTFQKENVSIQAPLLPSVERERPKTSTSNHSLLKKNEVSLLILKHLLTMNNIQFISLKVVDHLLVESFLMKK